MDLPDLNNFVAQAPDPADLQDRIRGVGDQTGVLNKGNPVFDAFTLRYKAKFGEAPNFRVELTYDTAYFLAYAIVAAGNVPELNGQAIASGLAKLSSGMNFAVGPGKLQDALTAVLADLDINLDGASGPVDLDPSVGYAVLPEVRIWCINHNNQTTSATQTYKVEERSLSGTYSCPSE
jgi:ABC-type branched-subunit amino acid transport system substrate-binding protein